MDKEEKERAIMENPKKAISSGIEMLKKVQDLWSSLPEGAAEKMLVDSVDATSAIMLMPLGLGYKCQHIFKVGYYFGQMKED